MRRAALLLGALRHPLAAASLALLLPGCAGQLKTMGAPRETPSPVARDVVAPADPGSEIKRAGELVITMQETINRVSSMVAPMRPALASAIPVEREPVPAVVVPRELEPPASAARDVPARPPPAMDRGPMCWWNQGGIAFHTRRDCPHVRPDASPVVCGIASRGRRACRTCGPGGPMFQGGVD